jgi:hypothetical protein
MWSYDPALPRTLDHVRLLIEDTDHNNKVIEDETITVFLTETGDNPYTAAAKVARFLSARYSRMNSVWVDSVRIDYAARAKGYSDLAYLLDSLSPQTGVAAAFVSGVSIGEMDSVSSDTDRPSSITVGIHDDPSV